MFNGLSLQILLYLQEESLYISWCPLRRIGVDTDIASVVVLLAGDAVGWITGQTIDGSGRTGPSTPYVIRPTMAVRRRSKRIENRGVSSTLPPRPFAVRRAGAAQPEAPTFPALPAYVLPFSRCEASRTRLGDIGSCWNLVPVAR